MNLSWNMDRISPKYCRYGYRRGPCWCSGEGRQARVVAKYIGGCGALRCYCSIQPNGLVTPCVYMPSCIVGDLRKSRFAEIWDHPLEAAFSDREDRGDHCGVCDYRAFCGGCRAEPTAIPAICLPEIPAVSTTGICGTRSAFGAGICRTLSNAWNPPSRRLPAAARLKHWFIAGDNPDAACRVSSIE